MFSIQTNLIATKIEGCSGLLCVNSALNYTFHSTEGSRTINVVVLMTSESIFTSNSKPYSSVFAGNTFMAKVRV